MVTNLFWKLFLKCKGWNTQVSFPLQLSKAVIIVGPHTSSWDFIIGLAYRSVLKINNAKFLGKKELFKPPFGWFFYWVGGTPVDRNSKKNLVEQVVEKFNNNDEFLVALSPEGTRKRVDALKTGFYFIAKQANVPIVMVGLDFKNKNLIVSPPFYTTNDKDQDLENVLTFYRNIEGKFPAKDLRHL
jgi:1-acyl-sn-glycerol-3-phosphate acyltransferase